ncbi:hypothetical protein SAMN05216410_3512 [Sanguibacter gelidistatuariae]|uniref:DUF4097 domain-containing protein n=1 Tax=Sanguibacter gelidistatuariae TaxID=1814289 RepID=A0A1G6VQQ5_9MICO|nr:DUF4097 family beta strand repeat-containing protein [Sanguibacter gelidistatuariae]SDD55952.1 hypothetical protein SAMN05216410_3512 [Sanguibacter gelidistatuariae]
MRNETWVIAEARSLRTTIAANASDGGTDAFTKGAGPVTSVVVSINAGSVRVEAHDRLDIELDVVSISDRPLAATLTDDTFKVSYDFTGIEGIVDRVKGLRDKDSADIIVRAPRTAAIRVTTVRGDVSVQDVTAPVTVTTVDGSVEAVGVTGPVSVSTAAGRVSSTGQVGPVSVKTGTGPIHLAGQLSRADVTTVSGAVSIETASGASVITTKTVSSRVALRVPADAGVDLRVRSVTGTIALDGADLRQATGLGGRTALVEHTEPGATVFLTANSVSGGVVVSHED